MNLEYSILLGGGPELLNCRSVLLLALLTPWSARRNFLGNPQLFATYSLSFM
jgi:hypothetical protein